MLKIQSTPVVPAVTKEIIKLPIDFRPNISPRIEINSDDCVETLFGIAPKLFNSGTSAIITDYEIESLKNLCPIFHKPQCHFIQPDVLPSTSASQENGSGEEPVDEDRPFEDSNNPRKRKLDGTEATEESQQDPKRVCLSEDAVPQAKKPFKPAKRAIRYPLWQIQLTISLTSLYINRRNLAGFKLQLNKRRYVAVGAKQLRNAKFSSKKKFSNWKGRKNFGR